VGRVACEGHVLASLHDRVHARVSESKSLPRELRPESALNDPLQVDKEGRVSHTSEVDRKRQGQNRER
jgi:hypothetical protein